MIVGRATRASCSSAKVVETSLARFESKRSPAMTTRSTSSSIALSTTARKAAKCSLAA